jgi:3-oxoacyl-[acyl-carrier protein] reductase
MDLGIHNRTALVCASSQGLGLACATALVRESVRVVINGWNQERLNKAGFISGQNLLLDGGSYHGLI